MAVVVLVLAKALFLAVCGDDGVKLRDLELV
jgi:hypothetical protein